MDEVNVTVLVDAKEEYTKQLINILKSCIYQGIKSIFIDSKSICNEENTPDRILMVFQDLLSRIPKWSQDIINKEYNRIVKESNCDWIEDLLKVVYITHVKVLTIVHNSQQNKKINLKIPTGSHFMHLCYIETAREFWKNPYLFSDKVSKYEYQKNMRDCELIIADAISETIRKQLPVKHILQEYLGDKEEETDDDDEDSIKKPISNKYLKKLESIVKRELTNTGKDNSKKIRNITEEQIRTIISEELNNTLSRTYNNISDDEELNIEDIHEEVKDLDLNGLNNIDLNKLSSNKSESNPVADPKSKTEADPVSNPVDDPKSKTVSDPESNPVDDPESNPVDDPKSKTEADLESKPEADLESKPEADPESKPEDDSESRPEADSESRPVADPESNPVADHESKPEDNPDTINIKQIELNTKKEPEIINNDMLTTTNLNELIDENTDNNESNNENNNENNENNNENNENNNEDNNEGNEDSVLPPLKISQIDEIDLDLNELDDIDSNLKNVDLDALSTSKGDLLNNDNTFSFFNDAK